MIRIVVLSALLLASTAASAEDERTPTPEERRLIAQCIEKNAGEDELKQMAACIGLVVAPCRDAADATTASIGACQVREETIWDDYLNQWYEEALRRLADLPESAAALKKAQRAWIAYRDAKCAYWEEAYRGGSIVPILVADCLRVETGRRALEMRGHTEEGG